MLTSQWAGKMSNLIVSNEAEIPRQVIITIKIESRNFSHMMLGEKLKHVATEKICEGN